MKKSLIVLAVLALSGCGSFKQVLDSNEKRKTEHVKFQVNRIKLVEKCYEKATTDSRFNACNLLQSQLQTEQGFTVRAELNDLPDTPEEQIKDGLTTAATLGVKARVAEKVIEGLNRPNDVVTVKEPYPVDRPTVIQVPEGSSQVPIQ